VLLSAYAVGYHGCEEELGEKLLSGRYTWNQKPAVKDELRAYDWLGTGYYFWENDAERAWQWASQDLKKQKRALKSPFVLGAFIEMRLCLDFTRYEDVRKLTVAHEELVSILESLGDPIPRNRKAYKSDVNYSKRYLDHAVINLLRRMERARQRDYDTVRSPFVEGEQAYKGAGFTKRQHMQICVINPACIVGFFRPPGRCQSDDFLSSKLADALAKKRV
jgi:hypothetical protein